jgi:predicted O-methyltransferase YrrM
VNAPREVPVRSLREFVWGKTDPFKSFPKRPSEPPRQGWYSDHPVFEHLISTKRPKRMVEVGSLFGGSAIHIAKLLEKHDLDAELTCVDTFLGSRETFFEHRAAREQMLSVGRYHFFDEFLGNVERAGVSRHINPFVQTSTNAARIFAELGVQFDFIYLDASHEYLDVLCDLRLWYPLLAPGGVLVGDDFEDPWYGIIRAAMEFADEVRQPLQLSKAFASSPAGGRENTKFMLTAA